MKNLKKFNFNYDKEYDILHLDIGKACAAYGEEIEQNIYLRINPKTNKTVGCTIYDYKKKTKDELKKFIPINIDWDNINNIILI